ncbi:MAG: hypothetical protein HY895_16780 [Deltaproteobacteria bacterium]|nr:hypothetical protein [Deltaproteobacteria bacterium]
MAEDDRGRMTDREKEIVKNRLLMVMPQHIGKARSIGMGELFKTVFGEEYAHRINDTRRLRRIVTELRREGVPLVSSASRYGGGYYLASAGSELADFCGRLRRQALRKLSMEAQIRKVSLSELVGQLRLDLETMD